MTMGVPKWGMEVKQVSDAVIEQERIDREKERSREGAFTFIKSKLQPHIDSLQESLDIIRAEKKEEPFLATDLRLSVKSPNSQFVNLDKLGLSRIEIGNHSIEEIFDLELNELLQKVNSDKFTIEKIEWNVALTKTDGNEIIGRSMYTSPF